MYECTALLNASVHTCGKQSTSFKLLSHFQKQLAVFKDGQHDVKIDVLSETHSLVALQGVYHTGCIHVLCTPSVCLFL